MSFEPGQILPDIRIATLGGRFFAFSDLRGRPALVYGWASWSPSRAALSALQKFYAPAGLELATVAFDVKGVGAPMEHLKKAGADHHLLIDSTCTLTRKWGVRRIPFLVLLDESGKVLFASETSGTDGVEAALKNRPDVPVLDFPVSGKEETERQFQVEVQLQNCTNYLGRGRTGDAKAALEKALELDPENEIIRGQIATLD